MFSHSPDSSTPDATARPADLDVTVDVCCETFERWLLREEREHRSIEVLPQSLERHVEQCDDCRAEYDSAGGWLRQAASELREIRDESRDDCAAEFLTRRIMAEVRAEPVPIARAHARARWRAAAAVFVAAVATVAVMSLWGPNGALPSDSVMPSVSGIASRSDDAAPAAEVQPAVAGQTTGDGTDDAEPWTGMMEPLPVPLVADFIPVVEGGETTFSL